MYKLAVPIYLEQIEDYGLGDTIIKLKEIGAETVFIAIGSYEVDENKRNKKFALTKKSIDELRTAGFKVGIWLWTFMIEGDNKYVHITSPNGAICKDIVCPSDPEFRKFAYDYLRELATLNPDIIMYDDDFRYGFLDCGYGCACENHKAYVSKLLGVDLPSDYAKRVFGGGKNKYRTAFLKANAHFFKQFALGARKTVDSVNSNIRLGLCSCISTWDFDGISALELAKILAGNTKPFLRLIGAPYWARAKSWGNRLADVIELERMESSWCDDSVEIFAEGDSYPRPRFTCSANMLEGFDTAMRASGAVDGILKYTFDYYSAVNYESGYNDKHIKNMSIYEKIDEYFSGKTPVGVRIYEFMNKFENMDVQTYYDGKDGVQDTFFSPASRMITSHTLPTVYNGLGTIGVAFGENVKYLDEKGLSNGFIIDVVGAKFLEEKGVDVGLKSKGETLFADREYYVSQNQYVGLIKCRVNEIEVKPNAKIESFVLHGDKKSVGSYTYQNDKGQNFLVLAFDGYSMNEHAFKHYARGTQILEFIKSLGKKLPAEMHGNPDCYMICRESDNEKAVWLGNFFTDECMQTVINLDKEYSQIEFINCTGKLEKDEVKIDSIPPYGLVGFRLRR